MYQQRPMLHEVSLDTFFTLKYVNKRENEKKWNDKCWQIAMQIGAKVASFNMVLIKEENGGNFFCNLQKNSDIE